jgi:hypothetical protein
MSTQYARRLIGDARIFTSYSSVCSRPQLRTYRSMPAIAW